MNNSNLDNITLVVPTYKRYPFLKRLLKYYDGFAIPIKILILDSTANEPSDHEFNQLVSNNNIIWKKFSSDITYWARVAKATEFIETDYVTLCADDDFIIPGAIKKCIEFLKDNPDYSSAHGLYFSHQSAEQSKKTGFSIGPMNHKVISETQDLSRDRVRAYLSGKTDYYPLYAVQRTETFRLIWSETNQFVSDWNLHELFSCCLSFIYGKMKILPVFYASREPNNYAQNNYEMYKRTYSKDKVEKAIEGLAKHLKIVEDTSQEEAIEFANLVLEIYLTRAEKHYLKHRNGQVSVWTRLRNNIGLRTRLRKIFLQGCHRSIYPKYFDDFKKVKDAVISADLTEKELNLSRMDFANQGNQITN